MRNRSPSLIRNGLAAENDPREVVTDGHAPCFGAELHEATLPPGPDAHIAETRSTEWPAQQQ
ncbi:hypothetical protein [Streptomyces liliiviolaceus]|uniref:hypothetical protein n=1 Tax=Streptomyces liliiviolaceus TaxID=2823109 RepID=UPI001FFDE1DE|nr:hypothetical protein [Streptomyces liliiviolaceus]